MICQIELTLILFHLFRRRHRQTMFVFYASVLSDLEHRHRHTHTPLPSHTKIGYSHMYQVLISKSMTKIIDEDTVFILSHHVQYSCRVFLATGVHYISVSMTNLYFHSQLSECLPLACTKHWMGTLNQRIL